MCESKQQQGIHTYEYEAASKLVNAYTCITQEYYYIQVLNVQWVAAMISGKIILILKITGKDTIGLWEYHIILVGKQFTHPILKFPPIGLWVPSKTHDGGVVVIQTHKYTHSFEPITYPTTQETHNNLGIYSLIIHPGVLARINDTPGKITHVWEKVEVDNKDERIIQVCGATFTLFGH